MLGHSLRLHDVISLILIPNAPSPANPTTGVSGQPIFAPKIEGKPYPQGPNRPGAKYFLPFSKAGYAFQIAQLLPISLEIIAFLGRPAWIALQAIRGDILSGSLSLESLFHVVPGSSSS